MELGGNPKIVMEPKTSSKLTGKETRSADEIQEATKVKTAEWSKQLDLSRVVWSPLQTKSGLGTVIHVASYGISDVKEVYLDYVRQSGKPRLPLIFHDGTEVRADIWEGPRYNDMKWVWPFDSTCTGQQQQRKAFRRLGKWLYIEKFPELPWHLTLGGESGINKHVARILRCSTQIPQALTLGQTPRGDHDEVVEQGMRERVHFDAGKTAIGVRAPQDLEPKDTYSFPNAFEYLAEMDPPSLQQIEDNAFQLGNLLRLTSARMDPRSAIRQSFDRRTWIKFLHTSRELLFPWEYAVCVYMLTALAQTGVRYKHKFRDFVRAKKQALYTARMRMTSKCSCSLQGGITLPSYIAA